MNIHDSIIIAVHEMVYGPPQALRDYLNNNRADSVAFFGLPFYDQKMATFTEFEYGKEVQKQSKVQPFGDGPLAYIRDVILVLTWVIRRKKIYTNFVGADCLLCFAGLLLRRVGYVKRVIFYTMDFSPIRFKNSALNWMYHALEAICIKHSNEVWNVSPRMAEGREEFLHISSSLHPQRFVPVGIWNSTIPKPPYRASRRYSIGFVGHLLEKQGVQLVLEALAKVVQEMPNATFLIIGGGEYEQVLKTRVLELGISKYVTFAGWIHDPKILFKKISSCGIAVATYKPEAERLYNFSYYADPGKLKNYLGAGIPVILTDISYNAKTIAKKKCGILVPYTVQAITRAILIFMKHEHTYKQYRSNALRYAMELDWKQVFDKVFEK